LSDTKLIAADSIADIPRNDWDALTKTDVYGQFGWLQAIEKSVAGARRPQYFVLYRNDELIAAAVGYRYSRGHNLSVVDELLFGNMASLAARLLLTPKEVLYFGPLIGHGRHIFWDRACGADDAAERIHLLLENIAARAESAGVNFVFGRIPVEEMELLTSLTTHGYLETQSWPISYLDVRWANFEDYISSLSCCGKNLPTKIRREAAAPEKKGVRIRRLDEFSHDALDIHRLINDTQRKYSSGAPNFGPEFIENLATYHAKGSIVSIASAKNEPGLLGCAMLLVANGVASGPLIGIAERHLNRDAFTYFNLAFYVPIRFCIENDIQRIYFGGGFRNMKRKRGCEQMDVSICILPTSSLGRLFWRTWFIVRRYWIQRKTRRDTS
jgi:predicted N-acyltransferase